MAPGFDHLSTAGCVEAEQPDKQAPDMTIMKIAFKRTHLGSITACKSSLSVILDRSCDINGFAGSWKPKPVVDQIRRLMIKPLDLGRCLRGGEYDRREGSVSV